MKKFFLTVMLFGAIFQTAFCQKHSSVSTVDGHPAWIMQGNVYEVNVRQYTPEGTFKAFAKHLDRLKAMGVQTLWFMPINPISKAERKGSLGSYYAVSDYTAVNPEYGNFADFKRVVEQAHAHGMKVVIDWVPNHTGADNRWITAHPDFFVKGADGKPAPPYNWMDVRQLDYKNMVMQDSMINAMKYWLKYAHIDGFRCDVAWNIPGSFWKRCISTLRHGRSLFMLAEGDKDYLHASGFDATYPWEMFHAMVEVAKGKRPATVLDSVKWKFDKIYPKNALELYFTSNHDENSDNGADYATFPGPAHAPFAVFTQTMYHSVPLIYSGQEEPVLRAIKFFDKDTIRFKNYARAAFYSTLLHLRKTNPALASDASFHKVHPGDDNAVYAYVREKAGKKVLVVLNFSAKEQAVQIKDASLHGKVYNVFEHKQQRLSGSPFAIGAWGYAIYTW